MSKSLIIFIVVALLVLAGLLLTKSTQPTEALIGVKHESIGQKHVRQAEQHEPYNSQPASSGPHYSDASAPIAWGIYAEEIQPEVYLHNLEHGGVVIAYNPDKLKDDALQSLKDYLIPTDELAAFKPARFILMPTKNISQTLGLAAWQYTLDLDTVDKTAIKTFYNQHVNNAPESGAAPTNEPAEQ